MNRRIRNKFYRVISAVLAFLLVVSMADLPVYANGPAAENESVEIEAAIGENASEFLIPPLSYQEIPGEGDIESIKEHQNPSLPSLDRAGVLSSAYTLDDCKSYMPPVRNQNPYGTCWAHATMGLAEIDLIKNKGYGRRDVNLSELQLIYFFFHSPSTDPLGLTVGDSNSIAAGKDFLQIGGNVNLAAILMEGWICAGMDEGELAYSNAANVKNNGLDEKYAFDDAFHLQNFYKINLKEDQEEAKRAIQEHGAITASYFADDKYYNGNTYSFYCSDEGKGTNHAVLIVGWDDNYSKDNFLTKPEGNGAWLIRNSWNYWSDTYDMGQYTYFWMSYYDKSLTGSMAMEVEPADQYDYNYHYDGSTASAYYSGRSGTKLANVFTAKGDCDTEILQAVSFELESTNVDYVIDIYKNLEDPANPESGILCTTQSGKTDFSGYYTIPLEEYVPLEKGETFSVVLTVSHSDGTEVRIPRETSVQWNWLVTTANSKSGESFVKWAGYLNWSDIGASGEGNFRIKALTVKAGAPIPAESLTLDNSELEIPINESRSLKASISPLNATNKNIIWSSSDEDIVTVDNKGVITAKRVGEAIITAKAAKNPEVAAECKVTVIPKIQIKNPRYTSGYGDVNYQNIILGRMITMNTEILPAAEENYTLEWESSDANVLKIVENGVVDVVGLGQAEITVCAKENPNLKGSVILDVNQLDYVNSYEEPAEAGKGILIKWDPVKGAAYYTLDVWETETNIHDELRIIKDCSFAYTQAKENVRYYYKLMPYTSDGNISAMGAYKCTFIYTTKPIHDITYVLNGGTNDERNPARVQEGTQVILNNPTRQGYVFGGWYLDAEFTESERFFMISTDNTEDLTLYAKWKPIQYYIRYEGNGSLDNAMRDSRMTYDKKEALSKVTYTREGYDFLNWNTKADGTGTSFEDQEEVLNLSDVQNSTVTLYAIWSHGDWRISYELNGGENAVSNPKIYNEESGDIKLADPARRGYVFDGWYLTENFAETSRITVITKELGKNLTLYAKWSPVQYYIRYDGNGSLDEAMQDSLMTYDAEEELKASAYTLEGKYFQGWNTEMDGSGTGYADREKVLNLSDIQDCVVTLYAIWGEEPPVIEDWGDITEEDRLEKGFLSVADVPEGIWTAGISDRDYTGKAITFENLHVYHHKTLLVEKRDYTVKYKNNTKAGTATVTVFGKGNYKDKIILTFQIRRLDISKAAAADIGLEYKPGKVQKGTTAVTYRLNGSYVTLKKGRDFDYVYPGTSPSDADYSADAFCKEGEYTIEIQGRGNYYGTCTFKETIAPARIPINKAAIAPFPNFYYAGFAIEAPTYLKLTYNGLPLNGISESKYSSLTDDEKADYHYTYQFSDNIEIGTARIKITGVNSFMGAKNLTFKIVGRSMKGLTVEGISNIYPYTGQNVEPAGPVGSNEVPDGFRLYAKATNREKERSLVKGVDYTVKYINNRNAGQATVVFTGINRYSGTLKKTFKIKAADIEISTVIEEIGTVPYEKGGAKPSVTVTDKRTGETLVQGVDYTVKYTNNKVIGSVTNPPYATIAGKGNYSGKSLPKVFGISQSTLANTQMMAKDVVYQMKPGICKPVVTLTDRNGAKLKAGTDYEIIRYEYVSDTLVTVKTKLGNAVTYGEEIRRAGEEVQANDIIPVSTGERATEICVTARGKGCYDINSTQKTRFRYVAADISKATVKVKSQVYTGKAIEPGKADITKFTLNGHKLAEDDYDIIGYSNNVSKGTAKLTIRGKGNYGGEKTVTFSITSRSFGLFSKK